MNFAELVKAKTVPMSSDMFALYSFSWAVVAVRKNFKTSLKKKENVLTIDSFMSKCCSSFAVHADH